MKKYILISKLAVLLAIAVFLWQQMLVVHSGSYIPIETDTSFQDQIETPAIADSEDLEDEETGEHDTEFPATDKEGGEIESDDNSVQDNGNYEEATETLPEQTDIENTQIDDSDVPEIEILEDVESDIADTENPAPDKSESETEPENNEEVEYYENPIGPFAYMSPHEAIVYNYAQLKSALSNDNKITTVYFGSDIIMQGGIRINPKKASIIINGMNPLNPAQIHPYTLTDFSSLSFYDTIYIDAIGTKTLLIRDLIITGKNYYGPFSVYDSILLAGVNVTYERVDYNGPQLGYHRNGTVCFKDCTVRIHGSNGGSPSQEFSEVKRLLFEGDNTIDISTSIYTVFWHPLGGTLTIADDSSLVLKSPDTSDVYGVFYADGYIYNVNISIGQRATFDMTISGVVAPDLHVKLSGLTVHEGGAFYLKTTKNAIATVLNIDGSLIVEKEAEFIISGYGGESYALLSQESGDIMVGQDSVFQITAENPYGSLINLVGRTFSCENPSSVLLYNASRDILASNTAGKIYVNAQQINYRNILSSGGLDDSPLYRWTKADKSNIWIRGTLAAGATGDFLDVSSNYNLADAPYAAPSPETFSMVDARVLSFGRLELIVADLTAKSTGVSGVTAPGAMVRVSFTQQGVDYTFPDVTADAGGIFYVPIDVALDNSTVVKVKSSWNYLSETAEVIVIGEGHLNFHVPNILEFYDTELSSFTKTIRRLNPNWKILVYDTREQSNGWRLYARLDKEMSSDSSVLPVLENALIFIDEIGNVTEMSADNEILILKHTSGRNDKTFPVTWADNKGILLVIKPGIAFADTVYTATISWTLVNGV